MFRAQCSCTSKKLAVVHHAVDHVLDVVGLVRFRGHDGIERGIHAVGGIGRGAPRRIVAIVLRQVTQQLADHAQAFGVVWRREMADAADGVVRRRAAQLFLGDVFVRHGLDDVGTGDEHVAGVVHHEDEIGDGGRIDRAARARSHDGGNLRHHAARQRVAQEDIGVSGERDHAFLNARAAGIVEADDRRAGLEREVHDLADFLRVGFGKRAAEDGEILREDVDRAAVDAAVAGDEAIAGDDLLFHAEIAAAVRDQLVHLLEGAFVEQQFDALARGEFAFLVLARAAFWSAALLGGGMAAAQFFKPIHRDYCNGRARIGGYARLERSSRILRRVSISETLPIRISKRWLTLVSSESIRASRLDMRAESALNRKPLVIRPRTTAIVGIPIAK